MNESVKIHITSRIAIVTLNREPALNAVSRELAQVLADGLTSLDKNKEVDAIVITGAGNKAFCAGVDLREARKIKVDEVEAWFGGVCNIYCQILATSKPVIAAINGVAAGAGFQIALVSDQRVAQPKARLGQPEINAGIPSIMGAHWMSLHLGWSMVQDLSMTGRLMGVEEAVDLKLVNCVVPPTELLSKSVEVAKSFAAKPRTAWLRTKARFREIAMRDFDEAFRAGVLGQQEAFARGEPQAIIDAFFARRAGNS
ncbi:MAG: enoyl-CoA hydratase/isomerase family protein [Hyphomicrobiaceae bacterium]